MGQSPNLGRPPALFKTPHGWKLPAGLVMVEIHPVPCSPCGTRHFETSPSMVPQAELNAYWCWFAMVREDYQGKGICHRMFDMVYDKVSSSILVHFGGQLTFRLDAGRPKRPVRPWDCSRSRRQMQVTPPT